MGNDSTVSSSGGRYSGRVVVVVVVGTVASVVDGESTVVDVDGWAKVVDVCAAVLVVGSSADPAEQAASANVTRTGPSLRITPPIVTEIGTVQPSTVMVPSIWGWIVQK